MRYPCWAASFALLVVGFPLAATADPISISFVDRSVGANAYDGRAWWSNTQFKSDSLSVTTTAPNATSTATLVSQASPSLFSGSLGGSGTINEAVPVFLGPPPGAGGGATYRVYFDVITAQQFSFTGNFVATPTPLAPLPGVPDPLDSTHGAWTALLFAPPYHTAPIVFFDFKSYNSASVSRTGLLPPGNYEFVVEAGAKTYSNRISRASADGVFNLSFTEPPVTPTPEPGAILLLGTGLLATARFARKHRSKHVA